MPSRKPATRTREARAMTVVRSLVAFQEEYQRNVWDGAPGNGHYAEKLLAIVDEARQLLGLLPRPSVRETMDTAFSLKEVARAAKDAAILAATRRTP